MIQNPNSTLKEEMKQVNLRRSAATTKSFFTTRENHEAKIGNLLIKNPNSNLTKKRQNLIEQIKKTTKKKH
jgi:transcriptional regulator NrdR family protein